MNCKQMVAAVALVCWMASPSLLAQDFLKQLEEKILKRQEEAKAKDSAAKETKNSKPSTDSGNAGKPGPGESLLQLNPPVATPREAGPNEAEPKVGIKTPRTHPTRRMNCSRRPGVRPVPSVRRRPHLLSPLPNKPVLNPPTHGRLVHSNPLPSNPVAAIWG